MEKFKKWFSKFELKRQLLLFFMVLYAVSSVCTMILPFFYKNMSILWLIILGITTLLFLFQYAYVLIIDHKELKRKLFKDEC